VGGLFILRVLFYFRDCMIAVYSRRCYAIRHHLRAHGHSGDLHDKTEPPYGTE
jgi:hypothetical protein